ncbi:MAG: NAD(P)H-dependent oxidoreductase [Clostridia bacterium]
MRIVVINGSPKGNYSVTLQTVLFLQKKFNDDIFEIINVGQQIKKFEKDFKSAQEAINNAELILFSYPVYTFLAPCQLHRFIELLKENNLNIKGKLVAQITTSKHFYDMTAHQFIKDNCADLGLLYVEGLSQDMDDLLTQKGQNDAIKFWEYVRFCAKNKIFSNCQTNKNIISNMAQEIENDNICHPKNDVDKNSDVKDNDVIEDNLTPNNNVSNKQNKDIVIVTDCKDNDKKLSKMIEDFQKTAPFNTRVVNIRNYKFDGGCLGCFKCAQDGKCVYKDGFDSFLRQKIQCADGIIYAFSISDHSMGSCFKMYDDRQFCNGHRQVTVGMPVGYLICGNLLQEENLRCVIAGRIEVGHNFLAGIVTNQEDTSLQMAQLVLKMEYALNNKMLLPQNFYGVGGTKIFRDLIYVMRGLMKADHKFYKANGIYDFPQKQRATILKMQFVGFLMSKPTIAKKMGNKMNEEIVKPYKKVIENIK